MLIGANGSGTTQFFPSFVYFVLFVVIFTALFKFNSCM
jgi:hypothetical protein